LKAIFTTLILSVSTLWAGVDTGTLWLSQIPPPERSKQIKSTAMHRLPSIKKRGRGPATLALWVRQGESILDAIYPESHGFDSLTTKVLSPSTTEVKHELSQINEGLELTLSGSEEGFYNAYLIGQSLQGETLEVVTLQSELINHSCREGHKHVSRNLGPFYGNNVPLEIVRTRVQWEDFHTFIQSGDVIEYQVFLYGKPIAGAQVTLTTHQGWQKSKVTDEAGKVSFEFIGEYFHRDKEFHSRDIYHYLLTANFSTEETDEFGGQAYQQVKYQATVSEKYRAATEIYTSTVWGLFTMVITMVLLSLGIFVYRQKTTRNFREIEFSEKD